MSDDLDLSALTDDQLVGLARAVAMEGWRRGDAVKAAMQSATLDEAEKGRVAAEAAAREAAALRDAERRRIAEEAARRVREAAGVQESATLAQTQMRQWAKNKAIALMVRETLGPGWSCTAWNNSPVGERRIYLDGPAEEKITYYVTGGASHPPGTLHIRGLGSRLSALKPRIQAIAAHVGATLTNHRRFDCDEAAAAAVPAAPIPDSYTQARGAAA